MKQFLTISKKTMVSVCTIFMFFVALLPMFSEVAHASSSKDFGQGYTAYLHSPNTGKPYYHIHFYHKGKEVYCLRLDTLQPCDGFDDNPLPTWVMKEAKKWQSNRWGYEIDSSTISWGKGLAIVGLGILAIILTICPFDGPAGDAVAWGLLLGTI